MRRPSRPRHRLPHQRRRPRLRRARRRRPTATAAGRDLCEPHALPGQPGGPAGPRHAPPLLRGAAPLHDDLRVQLRRRTLVLAGRLCAAAPAARRARPRALGVGARGDELLAGDARVCRRSLERRIEALPPHSRWWLRHGRHELAHNLAPGHDARHETLMERMLEAFVPKLLNQHAQMVLRQMVGTPSLPMPPGPPVGWRGGSHFAPGQAHPRPPNGWG